MDSRIRTTTKSAANQISREAFLKKLGIAVGATSLIVSGCNKDDDEGNGKKGGGKITMTMTAEKSVTFEIGIAGTGSITIDWGDGTGKETFSLSSFDGDFYNYQDIKDKYSYKHYFGGTSSRIIITGENITALYYGYHSSSWPRMYLTSLDVSGCKTLTWLDCRGNALTSLDVSKNTALTWLFCSENQLTSLDVSKNTALTVLVCLNFHPYYDKLTSLDVSKNTALRWLDCEGNKLETAALNALFGTLHSNTISGGKTIIVSKNPGTAGCNRSIAESKGWKLVWN